ncbi:BtrH N-terminal domain-containing protein [Clostridium estertheticum]|uniref:BtrH N-terminal domain-containing protein n=1 Tax=Clostridium estertheticum TaxID=238834 RepID=UPI001CF331C7|nr:BtrH N-terminal domain-containing protein [Clostridium estertheticum]MCB2339256.1 BtrH N-terminal domain-containing protein [Clostridium estertheticum]
MPNIISIIVVVIALIIYLYFIIFNFYQQKYYNQAYSPKLIRSSEILKYPEKYSMDGFVSVSSQKQYQEAAALKMINDKINTNQNISINNINFLMGYTYGASFNNVNKSFLPFLEPISCAKISAPFLGLNMDYRTSNSPKIFVDAVKYYISEGYPVLAQVDMGTLLGRTGFYSISELIVGYNKNGFYYYETLGINNEKKKYVSNKQLIAATNKLNTKFKKPWKYGFCIFKASEEKEQIKNIIKINGENLIGETSNSTASGAQAIAAFANHIKETKKIDSEWVIEALEYSRRDNAEFFEEFFKDNFDLSKVANLFKVVSENYNKALKIIKVAINDENIDKVSDILLESSQIEEQIGKILEKASYEVTSN